MKKIIPFLMFFVILSVLFSCVLCAAEDDPESCRCGRPYHTQDEGIYDKYDCVECGQKISNCTCRTCWCGAKAEVNGAGPMICANCGKNCIDCICADRDAMLFYEAERRAGRVALDRVRKPSDVFPVLLCLLITAAMLSAAGVTAFKETRVETVRRNAEKKRLAEERERIMLKIEAEENGGRTKAEIRREEEAVRAMVRWDTETTPLGAVFYELTAGVRRGRGKAKFDPPSLAYAFAFVKDKDKAVSGASEGKFGPLVKEAVNITEFFDNDFYEFVKKAYADILPDEPGNEIVHLANAACMYDVAVGAAAPVMERYAEQWLHDTEDGGDPA